MLAHLLPRQTPLSSAESDIPRCAGPHHRTHCSIPKSVSTSWVRMFTNREEGQMRKSTFAEEQIAYALRQAE